MPLTSHTKDRMPHIGHVSRAVRYPPCIGVLEIASVSIRQWSEPVALSPTAENWEPLAAEEANVWTKHQPRRLACLTNNEERSHLRRKYKLLKGRSIDPRYSAKYR